MKNTILLIGTVALGVTFAQGQNRPDSLHSQSTIQSTTSYQGYPTSDMAKVNVADLPALVQKTLADPGYEGWENSTFYYNSASREYSYQPVNSSAAIQQNQKSKAKWIRFDQEGKRKPDDQD